MREEIEKDALSTVTGRVVVVVGNPFLNVEDIAKSIAAVLDKIFVPHVPSTDIMKFGPEISRGAGNVTKFVVANASFEAIKWLEYKYGTPSIVTVELASFDGVKTDDPATRDLLADYLRYWTLFEEKVRDMDVTKLEMSDGRLRRKTCTGTTS